VGLLKKGEKVQEQAVKEGNTDDVVEDDSVVATQEAEVSNAKPQRPVAVSEAKPQRPDAEAAAPSVVGKSRGLAPIAGGAIGALAEDGFEGLDLGFGAFPIVVLQNTGDFTSSEGAEFGTEFDCIVMNSREKFICKNTKADKDEEDFFYSYDKESATNGEPATKRIGEWAEKGWGYEWKPYLDVAAQLVGGEYDGELVMFSIPKTSIARFSGYLATVKMKAQVPPSGVITRVYRGDKITKVKYPFFPWAFKMVSKL